MSDVRRWSLDPRYRGQLESEQTNLRVAYYHPSRPRFTPASTLSAPCQLPTAPGTLRGVAYEFIFYSCPYFSVDVRRVRVALASAIYYGLVDQPPLCSGLCQACPGMPAGHGSQAKGGRGSSGAA
jgi:hypothetical protein